jgi:ElaB/YqjD/DUF883 family membrane-anchored ribosome-binding protein
MEAKTGNKRSTEWDHFLTDLRAVVRDGEGLLKAGFGRARERAAARVDAAGRYVHERPYPSVAIGFGLGMIAGLLLHRSFRRSRPADED